MNYHGKVLVDFDDKDNGLLSLKPAVVSKEAIEDFVALCPFCRSRFKRAGWCIGSIWRVGARTSLEHDILMEAFLNIVAMHDMLPLQPAPHLAAHGAVTAQCSWYGLPSLSTKAMIQTQMLVDDRDLVSRARNSTSGKPIAPILRHASFFQSVALQSLSSHASSRLGGRS